MDNFSKVFTLQYWVLVIGQRLGAKVAGKKRKRRKFNSIKTFYSRTDNII